ncbi:MAG: bifunctional nuclease domain-containing protein, partial [Bacteroidota bacterium]
IDNVFYAKLICSDDHKLIDIDSRTSDAIAMALRFDCPIFTNELVLKTANEIEFNVTGDKTKKDPTLRKVDETEDSVNSEYEFYPLDELEDLLKEAIENEDYEKASKIRDEIKKRNHS